MKVEENIAIFSLMVNNKDRLNRLSFRISIALKSMIGDIFSNEMFMATNNYNRASSSIKMIQKNAYDLEDSLVSLKTKSGIGPLNDYVSDALETIDSDILSGKMDSPEFYTSLVMDLGADLKAIEKDRRKIKNYLKKQREKEVGLNLSDSIECFARRYFKVLNSKTEYLFTEKAILARLILAQDFGQFDHRFLGLGLEIEMVSRIEEYNEIIESGDILALACFIASAMLSAIHHTQTLVAYFEEIGRASAKFLEDHMKGGKFYAEAKLAEEFGLNEEDFVNLFITPALAINRLTVKERNGERFYRIL